MSPSLLPGFAPPDPELERAVRARLEEVEASLEKAVRADAGLLAETAQYLLAAGGKRFRPMLVLLSGYVGDPTDPRLIPGSVAIELVHLATLYHDDVIDEADSRRGRPSVNARWDNTVAILTGDYLFARASEISTDLGTDISALLARTIATLCDGQIREVESSGRVDQTVAGYRETIRRKTGVLIATSCRMGGMLSDAPREHLDRLEAFGEALGMAFQLSDDIMDLTASASELGKEPGVDLQEGVYTLPVLLALGGPDGTELAELLADRPPVGERMERALAIVRTGAVLDAAREAVAEEVARAIAIVDGLPGGVAAEALVQLARFLAARCGASADAAVARLRATVDRTGAA
ncbi:MAG: polyprenyl synthetase family protein [Actinomycetota bacterium]